MEQREPHRSVPRQPPAAPTGAVYLRSLALQASWNPQRMQNLGLLVALVPWLRRRNLTLSERRRFCRRHFQFFNTNPYLANFIIGGLLQLEGDGEGEPSEGLVAKFKDSLGRSFASLGDQLFWLGLRPALLLFICILALWERVWLALAVLILFAILQLELRRRALGAGMRLGLGLVDLVAHPAWHRAIRTAKRAGMLLAGVLAGCHVARLFDTGVAPPALPLLGLWLLGVGLPALLGRRIPPEGVFLLAVPLALALSYL